MSELTTSGPQGTAVIWHDLECGSYTADLGLWERLAADAGGPVLDLGCGTGRVALHLARLGHGVVGVDRDEALIKELDSRAARHGLPVEGHCADACRVDLGRRFPLVLAPMQLIELLPGKRPRADCLRAIAAHLSAGGEAALALIGEVHAVPDAGPPLPDVREIDGWIHSSLPLPTIVAADRVAVRRLRQLVSPAGELRDEVSEVFLYPVSPKKIEQEALACGLRALHRFEVAPSADHIGSTVVILEAG